MSQLSDQGKMVLEEWGVEILHDITFDKRYKIDPETGLPITNSQKTGIIDVYTIGVMQDKAAGITGGPLECSPAFKDQHKALVWAAKHEYTISQEVT